jgi:hypothetical protein
MINNFQSKYSKYKFKYLQLKQHMTGGSIVKVMDNILYNRQSGGSCRYCQGIDKTKCTCKNSEIDLLLNKDFTSNHPIIELKNLLNKYIATPWGYDGIMPKYWTKLDDAYKKAQETTNIVHINNLCQIKENNTGKICSLCANHGGNLFAHSQWSALQVLEWFKTNDILVEGLDLVTCIVASFFHDIGKGGDCYYDMYSDNKYHNKGDESHPEYSGHMILGRIEFNRCQKANNTSLKINELIKTYFINVDIREIALSGYMHWEFGKLNYTSPSIEERYYNYVKTFIKYAREVGYDNISTHLLSQLKLCILVGCADIAAGSDIRLKEEYKDIISPQIYPSTDGWVGYGMDVKYEYYRNGLIDYFINNIDKMSTQY